MTTQKKAPSQLQGNLFLLSGTQQPFASDQVRLLQAIEKCGSITKAAKEAGISYKTAWDRIDTMNNMSGTPLVIRTTGGAQGGGTELTDYGKMIVEGFLALEQEHTRFLQRIGSHVHSLQDVANFMRKDTIRASARNRYLGVVEEIIPGAVNTEVSIRISESQALKANISEESREWLGLQVGTQVVALIKSSWVMIGTDPKFKSSANNKLIGKVIRISEGAVNTDVVLDLGDAKTVVANITNASVKELGIKEGDDACAFFKDSSVILLVDQ